MTRFSASAATETSSITPTSGAQEKIVVQRRRRLPSSAPGIDAPARRDALPDVIDKPLAWTFAILPSGRMLAHSLVVSLPVLTVVVLLAAHRGYGQYGMVFSAGYLSHIAGDFYPIARLGMEYYFFPNLFWPFCGNPKAGVCGAFARLASLSHAVVGRTSEWPSATVS